MIKISSKRRNPKDGGSEKGLNRLHVAIALAALLLAAAAPIKNIFQGDDPPGRLVLSGEPSIQNGEPAYTRVDGFQVQNPSSMPKVIIPVRNVGSKPIAAEAARIRIVDSTLLQYCFYNGGGGGDLIKIIREIELPTLPIGGERTIEARVDRLVPEGEIRELELRLEFPNSMTNDLYALDIELESESGPLDLGQFVVSGPGPPPRGLWVLTEGESPPGQVAGSTPEALLESDWCLRRNLAEVRRVTGRPGIRLPDVGALGAAGFAKKWERRPSSREARSVAEALMESSGGPLVATFVAERSGDAGLAREVRRRAARTYSRRLEDSLASGVLSVNERDARIAYWLAPSRGARDLVARVQALDAEAKRRNSFVLAD